MQAIHHNFKHALVLMALVGFSSPVVAQTGGDQAATGAGDTRRDDDGGFDDWGLLGLLGLAGLLGRKRDRDTMDQNRMVDRDRTEARART